MDTHASENDAGKTGLNGKEQLLLAEYQEIGQCWRHDDQVSAHLTAVLFPLAVTAVLLPFLHHGIHGLALIPVAAGGTLMMTFWLLYYLRMESRFALRFTRAKEIERTLRFEHHIRFNDPGLDTKFPSITRLRKLTFCLYCMLWIIVLFIRWH